MKQLNDNYGSWALVTGASSGIGEEFSRQLAAKQFNLVLVARSQEKLATVATAIKQKYPVEILVVALDLSHPDFLISLSEKTALLDIGLLVSNAGGFRYGGFLKRNVQEMANLLSLNTHAHMVLAHHYGNKMKAKKKGGIILVSSMGAFSAIPYMANYTAAKAYVLSLGESLNVELKEHGIDVTVLTPGTTETPGTMQAANVDNKKLGVSFMSPDVVVQKALDGLGKKVVVIPGGMNKFSFFLGKRILSRMIMTRLIGKIIKNAISREIV
jgi:short-subunit dehydrogenase